MLRTPVTSSNLRSVGYDLQTQKLEIEFKTGLVYEYSTVPVSVYQELMSAVSHGRYFNQRIKKNYPYRRIR